MIYCMGNSASILNSYIERKAKKDFVLYKKYGEHREKNMDVGVDNLNFGRIRFDTWDEGVWLAQVWEDYFKDNPEHLKYKHL